MNSRDLAMFGEWFDSYTSRHFCSDPADQRNIDLKLEHSARVRAIISTLARDLDLSPGQQLLAGAVGLLHDVGRFPQFTRFRTFRDNISVNHGKLGAEVLEEEGVLAGLPRDEQEIITTAVRFHNAFAVPELPSPEMVLFVRLARDADKLDIWRIFTGLFEMKEEDRPSELGLGFPDTHTYSSGILDAVRRLQPVSLKLLKTLDDFKLLQLSWIPDLNFPVSFRLLLERNYINRLISLLPDNEEIQGLSQFLHEYAAARAGR